jgi:hypothetical protein
MQPRIYTYKITFEEIPHWYWGIHKEKRYNDGYMGSPVTHKWMWDFYTPVIQVLEFFPNTEEGWKEALSVEKRLIYPDLNNPLCLNEGCGCSPSSESSRKGGQVAGLKNAQNGRMSELGKKYGPIFGPLTYQRCLENGTWKNIQRLGGKAAGRIAVETGQLASFRTPEHQSKAGSLGGKSTQKQKWIDPDHPEFGVSTAAGIVKKQRARGLPSNPENRVRVE